MIDVQTWRKKATRAAERLDRESTQVKRWDHRVELAAKAAGIRGALRVTSGISAYSSLDAAFRGVSRGKHTEPYLLGLRMAREMLFSDPVSRAIERTKAPEEPPQPQRRPGLVGAHIGLRIAVTEKLGPDLYRCKCVCGHEFERKGSTLRTTISVAAVPQCPAKCVPNRARGAGGPR